MTLTQQLVDGKKFEFVSNPKYVAVTFEGNCNLRCKHCYWSHEQVQVPKVDDWSQQIQQLVAWGSDVAYAGRVLSDKGAEFIQTYCRESGKKVGIVDNGYTILKYPAIMHLYEYVNISIDGVTCDHDAQRGKEGSCEVAWKAVHGLKKLGHDPIISSCVTPINIGHWEEFEKQICDSDTRLSCTPVLGTEGNKGRIVPFTDRELLKIFETLLSGCSKLIKLYLPRDVLALMPILRECAWEMKGYGLESEVNGVLIFYQPLSIDTLITRNLSWNGEFYTVSDADDSFFHNSATEKRVLEIANKWAVDEHGLLNELL